MKITLAQIRQPVSSKNRRAFILCNSLQIAQSGKLPFTRIAGYGLTQFLKEQDLKKTHTPPDIRPPFARYSHAVEVPPGQRLLFASGQLGIDAEDQIPKGVEGQTALCFENIRAILASAGMTLADVVRINAYVTGREHLPGYMKTRDQFISDPPPASTLMIVSGFAREEFVVEIEVVAAAD